MDYICENKTIKLQMNNTGQFFFQIKMYFLKSLCKLDIIWV